MKIFMFGGTGLLGSEGAKQLIEKGHEVSAIALPPLPEGAIFPKEMKIEFGNYLEMSDDEIANLLKDMDGVAFCSGIDERIECEPPVYEKYYKYNIAPVERIFRIAKQCGVKHAVVLGSYFSHFDKIWGKLELAKNHPYIRSRRDQEQVALSFADENFDVAVLELPYIFGVQPGRKPVWVFMVEIIESMKPMTAFCKGGTTMVTVRQVGECIVGAFEKNKGGNAYPIGYYNMTWKELYKTFHKYMGCPKKPYMSVPKFLFNIFAKGKGAKIKKAGKETGLDYARITDVMGNYTYIDKKYMEQLGATPDDIDSAIGDSVKLSLEIVKENKKVIDMRGE